jgi:hypothetical protein
MSWTTGTQTECLSANTAVGSTFNTFTSAQYIGPSATAAGYLAANFFLPSYGAGKTLLVKAFGILGTTGTPNLTVGLSANTTQGTYNSSGQLATTAAVAQSSGVTTVPWELDVLITCVSTGSSGTFLSDGMFKVYNAITSATAWGAYRCSSSTANPNTAYTLSTETAYYLELFATWGTSNSANLIQCYNIAVLGIN